MRRARPVIGLLLLFSALSLHGVELDDILQALLDQALTVRIIARVTENGRETVQSYELTQVTISGRAVRLRLEGGNLTIVAEFTPYENRDGSIVLVAEGQIFLTGPEEEVQYRTSLRSVPLALGESVLFYPLGRSTLDMDLESEDDQQLNIELEVEVASYQVEEG
jgi:predicted amino acid-binding ACT domain protein